MFNNYSKHVVKKSEESLEMYRRQELLKTFNFIRGRRLLFSLVFFALFFILLFTAQDNDIEFMEDDLLVDAQGRRLTDLEDVLLSPVQPISGRTIFFHETKRHSAGDQYVLNFTTRVACSIESAALHNPNFKVFVLFSSSLRLPKAGDRRFAQLDAILSYKNVQLRQVSLKQYAKDTPVEQWVQQGVLQRSRWDKVSTHIYIVSIMILLPLAFSPSTPPICCAC